jgi:cytochrome P450
MKIACLPGIAWSTVCVMAATRVMPKFDPLAEEVIANPYPTYTRLREAAALCRGGLGQWVLTRYADVAALLRDPRLSSTFPPEYHEYSLGQTPALGFLQRIILTREGQPHAQLRRLMGTAFRPGAVRGLERHVAALVDELIAPVLDGELLDVVRDLAFPLPVKVVCELLGVPAEDRESVWPRAADLAKALGTIHPSPEDLEVSNAALLWLREYIADLLGRRRRNPGDDQLSLMLAARDGADRLSDEDIVDNAVFLFFAGFETTMGLISNGLAALLDHPAELARVRSAEVPIATAVEECLRYDSPIQWVARYVREPVELDGRAVRAGRALVFVLGSADRDPRQFPDPDRFDVGRTPNQHLAFGGGNHTCMGAALARLEGRVLVSRLLHRFRALEPAGPRVRRPHPSIRAYASIPVRAVPA